MTACWIVELFMNVCVYVLDIRQKLVSRYDM